MNLPSSAGKTCAHDDFDYAMVFRVVGCGFHQGQSVIHLVRAFGEQMQKHLRQSLLARNVAETKGEMPRTSSAAVNSHAMRGFLALSASSSAIAANTIAKAATKHGCVPGRQLLRLLPHAHFSFLFSA
jgi:hypothetical protein